MKNDEAVNTGTDEIEEDVDGAFNDEELVDAIDAAAEEADGAEVELDDDDDEEVPGVTDDAALDERPTGAGPDRGDGRDDRGQFASKEAKDAHDQATAAAKQAGKSPAEQKAAGNAAAAAAAKPAAAPAPKAEPPKWEPFQVRADKSIVPIDEAKIAKVTDAQGNTHVLIGIPEKDFPRFQQRIGRGIAGERRWRDLTERERELEFARKAPQPKSDAEIEAAIVMESVLPHLGRLMVDDGEGNMVPFLNEQSLEALKLKVELAQVKSKQEFAVSEAKRREELSAGDDWQRFQTKTLVDEAFDLAENHPELAGMKPEHIREVLQELALPVRDQLVYRENGEPFVNNEYLFKLLKRAYVAPASSAAPAQPATPAPAAKPDNAERFNSQQDTAAKPQSTSLKNQRGTRPLPERRPSRQPVRAHQRTSAQQAEDDHRSELRRQLSSDSFD